MHDDGGGQRRPPHVLHRLDEEPTDEVAEEDALEEPHGVHESQPTEVDDFGVGVVTRRENA